jgi:myo-inositol 2-dehydrogenase / D-chiro-inositol 1-dehydrogenase
MKVAIIGVGRMGRRHLQVVRDLGLELAGVCDQSAKSLETTSQEYAIPRERLFRETSDLLKQSRPECVIVATTAPTHCSYTCQAAEAGVKFILCEKPMGISLSECDRMIEACRENDAKLAINHQMRFMEQYTKPKAIIESAAFGGLSSVTVVAGNMGMAMNGTHYFEMFRYMADETPEAATAWFSDKDVPNPRGSQFHDRAGAVRLTTAGGKRFYMEIGADQGHGLKVTYAGPKGILVVDELLGTIELSVREEQYRDLPTTRYGMPSVNEASTFEAADAVGPSRSVLEALIKDEGPPSGEDGRTAIAALVAAYVSNETQHVPIRLDSDLPRERVFPWA